MSEPIQNLYEQRFGAAIQSFWGTRDSQANQQIARGASDAGTRGSVTGGQHLAAMENLVADVFADSGIPMRRETTILPGYYRGSKNWDGVVTYRDELVAILELKSQSGSFGNNLNNRVEEMIGQGHDINQAARRNLLGNLAPWFGYMMVVEDSPRSTKPVAGRMPHELFPLDEPFQSKPSYIERYAVAFRRLRLEGELSAACLVATDRASQSYWFPDPTMSFTAFAAAIRGRVVEVLGALG